MDLASHQIQPDNIVSKFNAMVEISFKLYPLISNHADVKPVKPTLCLMHQDQHVKNVPTRLSLTHQDNAKNALVQEQPKVLTDYLATRKHVVLDNS